MLSNSLVSTLGRAQKVILNQVRHSGGGKRRPSKAPRLNWKQKNQLGWSSDIKKFKPKPFGYVEDDLEPFMKPTDIKIMLNSGQDIDEPVVNFDLNIRKTVQIKSLFGSSKPFGALPDKPRKQNFSHSRIFGKAKATNN